VAFDTGLAQVARPDDLRGLVEAAMWTPRYRGFA